MKTALLLAASLSACGSVVTPGGESAPSQPPQSPQSPPTLALAEGVEVVAEVPSPRGIAVGGDRVYVTSFRDPGIFSAPAAGGVANKIATADFPTYVAVDATHVYWTDLSVHGTAGSIGRVATSGGAPQLLATNLQYANSATLIGGDLCFAQYPGRSGSTVSTGSVECVSSSGTRAVVGPAEFFPYYVATNGTQLCWHRGDHGGSIACRARAGGPITELVHDEAEIGRVMMVAVDAHDAYWVHRGGAIRKASLTGGSVVTLVPADTGETLVNDLAIDATHVYWIGPHGPTAAVFKVPKGGGTVTTLALEPEQPMGIALDATHVYWTATPKFVKRIAK